MTVANAMDFFLSANPNIVIELTVKPKNGYGLTLYVTKNFNYDEFKNLHNYEVVAIGYNQNQASTYKIPSMTILCESIATDS